MSIKYPFRIGRKSESQSSSLIVAWAEDAGKLGSRVVNYLNGKLASQDVGEIEPVDFFPLDGVLIEDNVAQFPESKFYYCPENNLLIFKSNPPGSEWYQFLNLVLDMAEHYCHLKEL